MANLRKVVVTFRGKSKINLIKLFREATGAGLCEAKDWAEGGSFDGLPCGVLGHHLEYESAMKFFVKLEEIVKRDNFRNDNNLAIAILDDNEGYKFDYEFPVAPFRQIREQCGLSLADIAHQKELSRKEIALADDIISALNAHPENVEMLRGMLKLAASAIRLAAQERIRFLP
jgi:hypothetical protein